MARQARNLSIDPSVIQLVHVWNRCVRRAFLCGYDKVTGECYEHRRDWSRERLEHLASVFAIDLLTFSIMSNHTHQVLRSRPDLVQTWDAQTVAIRWLSLTPTRFNSDATAKRPTQKQINRIVNDARRVSELRLRLSDISWWMRYFSQHIARRANAEDDITGHFWEARYGSYVLSDERSILSCMIYVDLNPIRAQMASTPEESDYTGAKARIDDLRFHLANGPDDQVKLLMSSESESHHQWERLDHQNSGWMCPIEIDEANDPIGPDPDLVGRRASRKGVLNMSLQWYLDLLDWSGREARSDKRGVIPPGLAPILERLGLSSKELIESVLSVHGRLNESFIRATNDLGDAERERPQRIRPSEDLSIAPPE